MTKKLLDRKLRGWKRDRPDHRDYRFTLKKKKLPPVVDLSNICPVVEDQGNIGSCTACSSTSMMESLYLKRGDVKAPGLSKLFVYYMTRTVYEGVSATNDSGCEIRNVMKSLAKQGACLEALWPYSSTSGRTAPFTRAPNRRAKTNALTHQILTYNRCSTLSSILTCLADGYTCVGGFAVPENMMSATCARTGVIRVPTATEPILGGHAVLFVGYNQSKKLLKFQNSWGSWGDEGYGYLPYDFFTLGLADDFWTVRTQEM